MAVLQVFAGTNPGQHLRIDGDRAVLGRHPDCEIVLDSGAVSRQHAQIIRENDNFYVEDLHSRNGTFVNGQQIQGRHRLEDQDRLKICELVFTFLREEPGSRARSAATLDGFDTSLVMVEDDVQTSSSTIMSKVDIGGSLAGFRLAVNPETKLRAMIEISQNLGKTVALDDVLPKLLDSLFKIFIQADRGFVILRPNADGPLLVKAVKHRRENMEDRVRISRTIINQVLSTKEAILSADASNDSRFGTSESIADLRIRSVMCAPLINSDGSPVGAIQIDTMDQRSRFQKEDLDVLASVASQAAIAIDNAQMHEDALKQQELKRDLELAHKVQRGLLPAAPPKIDGYHFFDFYEPAIQVGGDYYDYIELPGGRLAVVLGDVSGHGVSAALLMAKLSGDVRYCLAAEPTPAEAMNRINVGFSRSGWDDRFVTFVLVVLDPKRHEVTIVNAGHMPPLLRHGEGQVEGVGAAEAGLPLGVDADSQYLQYTRRLEPGDFLTIFTDGISEAMNTDGELYGLFRLREQIGAKVSSVAALGRHILDDVKCFVGGRPQSDDMCLACFGRSRE